MDVSPFLRLFRIDMSDELLQLFIMVFSIIPVSIFLIFMLITFTVNFGIALVLQTAALVLCLAWFLPTLLVSTLSALVLHRIVLLVRRVMYMYESRNQKRLSPSTVPPELENVGFMNNPHFKTC